MTARSKRRRTKKGDPKPSQAWKRFSPALLLSEGIFETGRVPTTSVLFVVTEEGVRLFHAWSLPDRVLDDYAVNLAVIRIENGDSSQRVARDLGVTEDTLRRALYAAGYQRLDARAHERLAHARAARKFGRQRGQGERRGRLVRIALPEVVS